ncbi:MAG: TonB-dependent receptor plug domain-containing protein [Flavobacteriaceae bacterium]|nr:TonB-dependent receptor plug domain-containing protein [Flavobacteriaceae bacterium]
MLRIIILSILFLPSSFAQIVNIVDEGNSPIAGVSLYTTDNVFVSSDDQGNVNLDKFFDTDTIVIQQFGFVKKKIIKSLIPNKVILNYNNEILNEVVISASKFSQKFREVPKKVTQINKSTIEFTNPMTSADLLERGGNVFIQKSQLGGGSPMIRGLSTNRLVLSVDGVRLNNAIYRGGNIHNVISVSPMNIENTEIIMGSASVLYGSDAIGGVMNFYTKNPVLSMGESQRLDINIHSRYSSAASEKMYHFDVNFGLKKIAFFSSISKSDYGNLLMGSNGPSEYLRPNYVIQNSIGEDIIVNNSNSKLQRNTFYDQLNFLQKVLYKPNKNFQYDLGIHFSKTGDIPRYDRLIRQDQNLDLVYGNWFYGPQEWLLINNQIAINSKSNNVFDKLKITFAKQKFSESRNSRKLNASNLNSREEKLDILSLNIDMIKKINSNSDLTYGLEYIKNKVESFGSSTNIFDLSVNSISSRYPNNSSLQSFGTYMNYKSKIVDDVFFQSGVRYSLTKLQADLSQNNTFYDFPYGNINLENGAFVGGIGLSWVRNIYNNWKFNINTAFRSPNIDDVAKVFDSEPGNVVVPNPGLKPERSFGIEFGGYFRTKNNIELDFSTYITYLYDALIRDDFTLENGISQIIYDGELSQIQALQNGSKSLIYGFEFGANMVINKNLSLKSQLNLIAGHELNELPFALPVRHIPPNFGNLHLIFEKGRLSFDAFVNFNSEISYNNLAESERAKPYLYALDKDGNPYSPSWTTYNFRSKYLLSDKLNFTLSFENISDKLYRPYSSGISAPGLNFIFSVNYAY